MASFKLENVKIVSIGELQVFDSGFQKVEFVVETNEDYPQFRKFESIKDNADKLIKFNKVGDTVDVDFNMNGRKYEKDGKTMYFNSDVAWKVFKAEGANNSGSSDEEDADLPF